MQHIEDREQMFVFQWTELQSGKYPELSLLFHIPNGGKRDAREAARLKKMGVKAGVPDLFLPVARGKFHGLFIEMKSPEGTVSKFQTEWITELGKQGYDTAVCYGFEQAQEKLIQYLTLGEK